MTFNQGGANHWCQADQMPLNPSALSGGLKVGSAGKNRVGEGGLGVDSELS